MGAIAAGLTGLLRTIRQRGLRASAARVLEEAGFLVAELRAARLFVQRQHLPAPLEDEVEFALTFSLGDVTFAHSQVRSEVEGLLALLSADPPERTLEIGTARGATLYLISRVATPRAMLASVDLPGGRFGGGYRRDWMPILRAMPRKEQSLKLIRADSHDERTLAAVRSWFGPKGVDFLLIDGDHSYEGVRADFEMYAPLVRPGGRVALHDIVPAAEERVGGVPRFWREIRDSYPTREIVENWDQGGYGFGLLTIPREERRDSTSSP